MSGGARSGRPASALLHALVVLVVCAAVYFPRLGQNGLRSTEGHRAIPAWTMLETGEALPTRMFGAVYMRKPPGIAWAIAASSAALGKTEFAARAPSALGATLAALLALWFGRRWFGARWGIFAGLAQALGPGWWPPGRSAEIETLNNLFTAAVVCAIVDLVAFRPSAHARGADEPGRREGSRAPMIVLGAIGFFGAALMKGPSSLPCVIGAMLACAIVVGRRRTLGDRGVWAALGVGVALSAALIGAMVWSASIAAASGASQASASGAAATAAAGRVSDKLVFFHLWRETSLDEFIGLIPLTIAGALPASLALLFPWGGDAQRESETADGAARLSKREPWHEDYGSMRDPWHEKNGADGGPPRARSFAVARALAWGLIVSAVIYLLVGVSNPRYTMPAGVFAPPLVAYVARGAAGAFGAKRARIARVMLLGRGWGWLVLLLGASAWWIGAREPQKGRDSGRDAGVALAASLPDGAVIWADLMVESRPETLWYAQQEAARQGKRVTPRWEKAQIERADAPPVGGLLLLVRSGVEDEVARYQRAMGDRLEVVATGRAHQYEFSLVRVVR